MSFTNFNLFVGGLAESDTESLFNVFMEACFSVDYDTITIDSLRFYRITWYSLFYSTFYSKSLISLLMISKLVRKKYCAIPNRQKNMTKCW